MPARPAKNVASNLASPEGKVEDMEQLSRRLRSRRARRMGIQGVPCFIVDGAYAISGAQEPEYFLPLFDLITTGKAAAE